MPQTDIDWTFASIPGDGEDKAPPARPPAPTRRGRAPVPGRRRRWALRLAALLSVLAVAGLAGYLLYWNGWQRVQGQISQEVTYEDTQALAGNAAAVVSLQSSDN